MNEKYTHITLVLDKSGSMQPTWADTIGGVNAFIDKHRELDGKITLSLIQFSTDYLQTLWFAPLSQNFELGQPNGNTALLDTLGRAIIDTGTALAWMKENERPGKVVFVIVTDGEENASTRYSQQRIRQMIGHQTDVYKWDFIYLGANQDAFTNANRIGIQSINTLNYTQDTAHTHALYSAVASNSSHSHSLRVGGQHVNSGNFTKADRDAVLDTTSKT